MTVTKDFTASIAVGIEGFALLSIDESLSRHSVYVGSDIHPNLVLEDIKQCGMEEWSEAYLSALDLQPGIHNVTGSVNFSEDDANYVMSCETTNS